MHRRIRRELGIPGGQGKRYSWGYGACPDLEDHAQVSSSCRPSTSSDGADECFQLIPEQSTAAMIVHHPEAKYYAVRGAERAIGPRRPLREALLSDSLDPALDRRVRRRDGHDAVHARACSSISATTSSTLRAPDLVREFTRVREGRRRGARDQHASARTGSSSRSTGSQTQVQRVNRAAARARARSRPATDALVAGAVGPLGVRLEPYGPTSRGRSARDLPRADGRRSRKAAPTSSSSRRSPISTRSSRRFARRATVDPSMPIIAQMTIGADGLTPYGATPEDVARALDAAGRRRHRTQLLGRAADDSRGDREDGAAHATRS